ncbi:MAG: diguanylate cyclase, partial [Candidatus Competibacteraceae bacterium]|nr:diguanylate cyclase [Candidatus Competibacteraceae bacterium]
ICHGKRIVDDLRQRFTKIVFFADKEQFTCTFSGGVAAFPEFSTVNTLIEAADLALYRAKHQGRNRVEIADAADPATGARQKTGDE